MSFELFWIRCCTFTYDVDTLNTKTIHSNRNSLNTFTKETGSNKLKLPKVGSNAIVPVPVGAGPNNAVNDDDGCAVGVQMNY